MTPAQEKALIENVHLLSTAVVSLLQRLEQVTDFLRDVERGGYNEFLQTSEQALFTYRALRLTEGYDPVEVASKPLPTPPRRRAAVTTPRRRRLDEYPH